MTDKLTALLHESSDLDFSEPDVDQIVRGGERQVRRRRLAVVAVAATVAIGAASLSALVGTGPDRKAQLAALAPDTVTWAEGSVLHIVGGVDVELGHHVIAYVRTRAGLAFVDENRVVHGWTGGDVEPIGRMAKDRWTLVGDDDGTLVGWLSDRGEVVVHDLATGEQVADLDDLGDRVVALDGRTAYVERDGGRSTRAVDVDTGESTEVASGRVRVRAAEDGLVAYGTRRETRVGTDGFAGALPLQKSYAGPVTFSTDGSHVMVDGTSRIAPPTVHDTSTGELVPLRVGSAWHFGETWIDDDTLLVLAPDRELEDPSELLACDVPSGECSHVADTPGIGPEPGFALPTGRSLWRSNNHDLEYWMGPRVR